MAKKKLKRLAIFASGRGTNLENLLKKVKSKKLKAEVALVVSDQPRSGALKLARRYGVDSVCLERKDFNSKDQFEKAIVKALREKKVDYLVLAGYMRILGRVLIRAYRNRIVNVHPALLPAFKGAHGIRDAFRYGVRMSGVTVHFVDEQVDHGPIILQKAVEIRPREALSAFERRIHRAEYEIYPQAVQLLVAGRLRIRDRKVLICKK